ncbi:MAG: hypothetical protein D4S02_07025 [Rhodocyclaceae bacterium]|nr:MAG: hypothetical protein D4S02_07025 [Rhodocyclaceae bacterium]
MARTTRDETREHPIAMDVVVDAYSEIERAMSWYCYLEEKIKVPFKARCIAMRGGAVNARVWQHRLPEVRSRSVQGRRPWATS